MDAARHFKRGKKLLDEGRLFDALADISSAYEKSPEDPVFLSYYGLLHGLERGQVNEAIGMCWQALERVPDNGDLYVNLGRVYLKAGQKADAVAAFQAGLKAVPEHPGLRQQMRVLGIRSNPVIASLPRSHPINRLLGRLRAQLGLQPDPNGESDRGEES